MHLSYNVTISQFIVFSAISFDYFLSYLTAVLSSSVIIRRDPQYLNDTWQ